MRILFIGNSHTAHNDMVETFRKLCLAHGIETEVTMLSHDGKGLDFHREQPEIRFNILFGNYDFVVLQHTAHPMGNIAVMHEAGDAIGEWISRAGASPVLYMTWAAKAEPEKQRIMSEAYRQLGARMNARVAPVGEAWQAFSAAHPQTELYAEDGQHANDTGARLAALTLLYTIFPALPAPQGKRQTPTEQALCLAAWQAAQAG